MPSRRGRDRRRQHVFRRPKETSGARFRGTHHCPECGKWCFPARDDAQDSARRAHPGVTVHFYQCAGWWHYTSMDAAQVEEIRIREAPDEDDGERCA
jgi:hypothetical protein